MSTQPILLLVHGPNFSVLHLRDSDHYKGLSLKNITSYVKQKAQVYEWRVVCFQSSHEGDLVKFFNKALRVSGHKQVVGVIVNAGAYSHTSLALADALLPLTQKGIRSCEVHLSHVLGREPLRRTSMLSSAVHASVCGMGIMGYSAAIEFIGQR